MKLEQDLRQLADRIRSGVADGDPYLLVLGRGVAEAAEVPSLDELSEQTGQKLEPTDRRLIDRVLYDLAAPAFYQDLANVIREGFLPRVVTTAYDSLLERTLEDAGLRAPYHYATLDLGEGKADHADASVSAPEVPLRIVHCHGAFDPGRLDQALGRREPSQPLRAVVVGFDFESAAVTDWLARSTQRDLWWVAPEPPPDAPDRLGWTGEFAVLAGESAQPGQFFPQLGLILLGLPEAAGAPEEDPDALDQRFLENQLAQAKVYKHSIEQRVASVGSDPAATKQLDYQAQQIGDLEQQLAKSFIARMRDFGARLQESAIDPDTVAFFNGQLDTYEREATKDKPNRAIMAAAQGSLEGLEKDLGPAIGVGQARA